MNLREAYNNNGSKEPTANYPEYHETLLKKSLGSKTSSCSSDEEGYSSSRTKSRDSDGESDVTPFDYDITRHVIRGLMRSSAKRCQMKLVVCASAKKLTVTILGVRFLPNYHSSSDGQLTYVYLKLSLSPDHEVRIRHKTTPQEIIGNAANMHDTFPFDISRRDINKRLLISAWSVRDYEDNSSFIGCMSFGIKNIVNAQQIVQGWYYFLGESLGRKKHLTVKTFVESNSPRKSREQTLRPRAHHVPQPSNDQQPFSRLNNGYHTLSHQPRPRKCDIQSQSSSSSLSSSVIVRVNRNTRAQKRHREATESEQRTSSRTRSFRRNEEYSTNAQSHDEAHVARTDALRPLPAGNKSMKKAGRTPTGRRHLRRKSYSSTDLLLFRMSYLGDKNPDDVSFDDDEYFGCDDDGRSKSRQLKVRTVLRDSDDSDDDVTSDSDVSTTDSESDDEDCDVTVSENPKRASSESGTESRDFVTASVVTSRFGEIAKRRQLHSSRQARTRSCYGYPKQSEVRLPNPYEFLEKSNAKKFSESSSADDKGYHSATQLTISSESSETDFSSCDESKTAATAADADSDYVFLSNADSKYSNRSLAQESKSAYVVSCNMAVKSEFLKPGKPASLDSKNKSSSINSLKTWIQRKASESSLHSPSKMRQPKSMSTGWLLRYKNASNETFKQLKRTNSLRKSSSRNCEHCIFSSNSLQEIMKKKGYIAPFRQFLVSEFSEENLDFWLECENYKHAKSNKRTKLAAKIFQRYLAENSPNEINIDAKTRSSTKQRMLSLDSNAFVEAQNRIFVLMEKDPYRRFQISQLQKCHCR